MRSLLTDLMAAVAIATCAVCMLTTTRERTMELRHEEELTALVEDRLDAARKSLAKTDRKRALTRQGKRALEREIQVWTETLEDLTGEAEEARPTRRMAPMEGAMATE